MFQLDTSSIIDFISLVMKYETFLSVIYFALYTWMHMFILDFDT